MATLSFDLFVLSRTFCRRPIFFSFLFLCVLHHSIYLCKYFVHKVNNNNNNSHNNEMFATYLSNWQGIPGAALSPDSLPAKQSFWDTPGITQVRQEVDGSKLDAFQRAQFLAASAPHSGDLLLALPIASCGLVTLDNEAVHDIVAVALNLGLDLGAPHTCRCGALVDARGQHGLDANKLRA